MPWSKLQFGVRERLLLAFMGIGTFSIIAAASGFFSLSQVGNALTKITEDRVPQVLSLLKLSRQAETIVRSAPALIAVTAESDRSKVSKEINVEVAKLNALVEAITHSQQDNARVKLRVKNVAQLAKKLNSNLDKMGGLVKKRLASVSIRKERLKLLTRIHGTSLRLVSPGLKLLNVQTSGWNRNGISESKEPLTEKQKNLRALLMAWFRCRK